MPRTKHCELLAVDVPQGTKDKLHRRAIEEELHLREILLRAIELYLSRPIKSTAGKKTLTKFLGSIDTP